MTPHSPIQDRFPRGLLHPTLHFLRGFLTALAVAAAVAPPATATLTSVSSAPADPRTCDALTLTVEGTIPSPCYEIVGAKITGPEPVVCVTTPCPPQFRIEIIVREPNPAIMGPPCPAVVTPYVRSFDVGRLPAGGYVVTATERVTPFEMPDTTLESSFASTSFTVREDAACQPGLGCYLFNFVPDVTPLPDTGFPVCTATAPPGGTTCLDLAMFNSVPVGGLQTAIAVGYIRRDASIDPFIHAISVEPVGRASGFQVGWTAEGTLTKLILYSPTGEPIPAGRGPIARICFAVPATTAPGLYPVTSFEEIVADSTGTAISVCPTFAPAQGGTICVTSPGCDLNGDGASDILDIIKLVRCALSAGDIVACPDSVAARADCNGDGSLDIRDVICCVRRILEFPRSPDLLGNPVPAGIKPSEIGFNGPVLWINDVEGLAIVELKHGDDWGGTQFSLYDDGVRVRVRDVKLLSDPASNHLEWMTDGSGVSRVMLYATTNESRRDGIIRMQVAVERIPNTSDGLLRLVDARSGTFAGAPALVEVVNGELEISGAVAEAPALLAARPNPFLGGTDAGFALPRDAHVTLRLYDVAGRLVRTLVDETRPAGVHHVRWDGTDSHGRPAPAAIYFARFEAEKVLRSERWLLLR